MDASLGSSPAGASLGASLAAGSSRLASLSSLAAVDANSAVNAGAVVPGSSTPVPARADVPVSGSPARPREPQHSGRRRRVVQRRQVWALRLGVVAAAIVTMKVVNHRSGDLVMPDPADVVRSARQLAADGVLWDALGQSLKVLSIGFGLASVVGVTLGVLFGGIGLLGKVAEPFIHALNSTPRVAFIPLIIVWLGLNEEAKIAVIWLSAVIPITVNTTSGIESADSDLTEMAKSFGARRRQLFWRVWIPAAVPAILTGLRIGASLAILGTVVSELYTAQAGLGGLLVRSSSRFRMDDYFAVVIVLMLVGISITSALRWIERRFLVWRVSVTDGGH